MPNSSPLINLGELSKPATVLIEKISGAVGEIFKPYQIGRIAQAEARADIIRAEAQVVISDIQRRALKRFVAEEERKQRNIEDITAKAVPDLGADAKPEAMEDDWVANFFDKCRNVSDAEMQRIWARLLASEARGAGTVSRRTVNILSSMDRKDAELFTALSKFVWNIAGTMPAPFIYPYNDPIYAQAGITFAALTNLDATGLVRFNSLAEFKASGLPKKLVLSYFDKAVFLEFRHESNDLNVGHVMLTDPGRDLLKALKAKPEEAFFDYALAHWRKIGIEVSQPLKVINNPFSAKP